MVVCDVCEKPIADVDDGNAVWKMTRATATRGYSSTVFYTHKQCHRRFEARDPEAQWWTDGLDRWLLHLGLNTGMRIPRRKAA